jgi:NAD(P)-dependent dehydrogenase (short-subunit alcohol dehydrogenase family)
MTAPPPRPPSTLAGKSVVIIGGTTGLGLSAAQAFSAAGAHLVVLGRNPESAEAAQAALGDRTLALTGDAADPATAPRCIEAALRAHGRFDALYHVAGGSGRRHGDGPLHELTDDGWRATLELNLTSVMYSNRAAVRQFLAQGPGGAILNLSSVLAFAPSPEFFSTHAYATAKAGIIGFSKAIAAHYARDDIRVNVLAPGLVETPMARRAAGDEEILRFMRSKQPLGGGGILQPSALDAAALYLLSDAARFLTGQVLAVDGGWSVSEGLPSRAP